MNRRFDAVDERLATIEARLAAQHDELNLASPLAMRATGERIARGVMRDDMKKLAARVEALERKAP